MIDGNIRTLGVLLACFVASVVLGQSAQRLTDVSALIAHPPVVEKATVAPVVIEAPGSDTEGEVRLDMGQWR